jgi:hypothetical protein
MSIVTSIAVIAFSGALFAAIPTGEISQKLLIAVLAFSAIVLQQRPSLSRRALILIWPFIAYCLIATFSAYAHSSSLIYTIAAVQSLLLGLIIYVWTINLQLEVNNLRRLRVLIYALVVIQFVFALGKLAVHGIDEKILIGTMSHTAGQLGFLFPAIAIPVLVFMMTGKNSFLTYLLVGAMFLFGVINEKRAVVFLLPLILLASLAVNYSGTRYRGRKLLAGGLIGLSGAVLGVSAIPSLNPGSAYGGDISFAYAIGYGLEYLTMDFGGPLQGSYAEAARDGGIQVGRVILWLSIIDWLSSADVRTLLFGNGFGTATPSVWLQEGSDPLFSLIGTRGGISGAGLAAVETGVVGLVTIGYLFVHIFKAIASAHRQADSLTARRWLRTLMIIHVVVCYDFFFYSTVLLRTLPLPAIFFALLGSIVFIKRWEQKQVTRQSPWPSPHVSSVST